MCQGKVIVMSVGELDGKMPKIIKTTTEYVIKFW